MTEPGSEANGAGPVAQVARLFTRLGFTAFGGPAAHLVMMHDEVVTRRGWLDGQRFLDLVGVTNLIPGPNSIEMAMHVGHERAGWRGAHHSAVTELMEASRSAEGSILFASRFGW